MIQILSIVADLAIIFLLAVQSWVLVKLLPEIKSTARNSNYFTQTLAGVKKKLDPNGEIIDDEYPQYLLDMGIKYCKNFNDKTHVHDYRCYNASET